ncbi:hypothetical protein O6H91_04G129500 [Diphasiastrum complanatum]|uniref:Uncharacterized protein n=1 Tax=Diphasiastrum complanatum TaxID=34168 RepID=A0ACC2E1C9_DIPCM|nr:hypothetical protein O6H91_04G129500 [Diphasiastrum complanatum]
MKCSLGKHSSILEYRRYKGFHSTALLGCWHACRLEYTLRQIWISSLYFQVETGRFHKVPIEEQFCQSCTWAVVLKYNYIRYMCVQQVHPKTYSHSPFYFEIKGRCHCSKTG